MTRYTGVYAFPESAAAAERLADRLGLPCFTAELHRFPDGESLVRCPERVERAILYRSLDNPNDKLVEIVLAASVLRREGARELCLVAPYMAYMRQDAVFRPGEPVSQKVIGAWLAQHFDRIVCVEPHLHRTGQLDEVFPGRTTDALSAAPVLAERLAAWGVSPDTVLVGPDEESAPLIEATAAGLGLSWTVAGKERRGDRDVTVTLPETAGLAGRPAVILDDVVSSGETILSCARAVAARGGGPLRVIGVHALHAGDVAARFAAAGIEAFESCDGVPHPSNAIPLAPLLAEALRR